MDESPVVPCHSVAGLVTVENGRFELQMAPRTLLCCHSYHTGFGDEASMHFLGPDHPGSLRL